MSEYADGFDDGKGEKFDELMVEIATLRLNLSVTMEELGEMRDRAEKAEAENATLREQLKDCSAVVDRQQEMLDRNAEQLADKQAKIDALMFEYCPIEMSLEQIMEWKKHQRPVQEG